MGADVVIGQRQQRARQRRLLRRVGRVVALPQPAREDFGQRPTLGAQRRRQRLVRRPHPQCGVEQWRERRIDAQRVGDRGIGVNGISGISGANDLGIGLVPRMEGTSGHRVGARVGEGRGDGGIFAMDRRERFA
ncbi:hypothetical protein FUT87_20715 [Mitsuaria sp. TWR114]|uniref:hypothetical protein n=1 Tax=Mitsuaria sp. TWR114 TaxID=2601731 RepID=UPI0011BFCC57|nr:hypothetical protein [Mitsuaria sp. TWR114]TXD80079.1 hypothetical protein FUT87_20715 [Mitsuaria sp. TWR114]